ncbi:MAG: PEP-CTERM sorting domain-containing protein [Phycisphaerales bacterium]|nr:PEP-CTERM sorting domain-containing protein [Phycisphaerales bacterium]
MNRLSVCNWMMACGLTLATTAVAPADVITYGTYIDSYAGQPDPFIPGNQDMNYGGNAALKVVTSPGSTSFPGVSIVRTLIELPDSFWTSLGNQDVESAVVSIRVRNLNSGNPFTRTVSAHPMLRSFVEGTGGTATSTFAGTQNTTANPIGADWFTHDGVNPWNAPGAGSTTADYDAVHSVLGEVIVSDGVTKMSWNLTTLINNPDTRGNIHDFGLMIKITDDLNYPETGAPQQFISFYSNEYAQTRTNPADYFPVVNFTVPEPASILTLGIALIGLGFRRKKQ